MKVTGDARCWGFNGYGQLGEGTSNNLYSPPGSAVLLKELEVVQVSTGYHHTCAMMSGTGGVCGGGALIILASLVMARRPMDTIPPGSYVLVMEKDNQ